jgi:hypothetical protein
VTSDELNANLRDIENDEAKPFFVAGLYHHGKTLPYIGWYWRDVDWDQPLRLGDCGSFIGFMENNKWGYPEWRVTPEQDARIKELARDLASAPTEQKAEAFFLYIQTCRPEPGAVEKYEEGEG